MGTCRYKCGAQVPAERIDAGYSHCTARACVARWRQDRLIDQDLVLVLVPKSGFQIVYKSSVAGTGRSSGRG